MQEYVITYVVRSLCPSGGFCFYGLDEPNCSDTYHALCTLKILDALEDIETISTVKYLQSMQHSDGGYDSIYSAYYSIRGLDILRAYPLYEFRPYVVSMTKRRNYERFPVGIGSAFRPLCYALELASFHNIHVKNRNQLVKHILSYMWENKGFGVKVPTLVDTYYALRTLKALRYDITSLGVERFVSSCENSVYGFLNIPSTTPGYLEHIHAGVMSSRMLEHNITYPKACLRFIDMCQRAGGGYARAPMGIPELEYTHLAVASLIALEEMFPNLRV